MKFFKNIPLKFDRSFSRGFAKQVLWLLGIMALVYLVLVGIGYFGKGLNPAVARDPKSHGLWYDVLFLLMDPGNMAEWMNSPFIALCALVGLVVFCGMVISLISNVLERRVNRFLHGEANYKTADHVVILGYNQSVPSLLQTIYEKHGLCDIVLMSNKDAIGLRSRIHASVPSSIENHLILLRGSRNAKEDLERLSLDREVREIYVLGEQDEAVHDTISIECVKRLAEMMPDSKPVDCYVQFDSHIMFSVLQSVDFGETELESGGQIRDRFNFRPFNFNEIWAQKALATIPQQRLIGGQPTMEYFPLDGKGITMDSPKRVHLFILGMNDMSISLAVNAAHILHFPNFRDGDFSTASTITFIAPDADLIGGQMRRQYRHLFDLARWRQIEGKDSILPDMGWNDSMKDPNGPYRHLGDKNFMDIQWEFIIGGMLDNEVHSYLEKCTFDENEITTIALCDEDSELNTKLCLALSDSVHRDANMILVRQKENPITANLVSRIPDHGNVRPFGGMSECYRENLTAGKYGKIINACYNDIDVNDPKMTPAIEEAWSKCTLLNKWSSVYSANMLFVKLRSMGLTDEADITFENIARLMARNDIKSGLQRAEHYRWVTEKLLLGFAPLTEEEKARWLQSRENQMKLRSHKKHLDICSNDKLIDIDIQKDDKVNSNLWAIYQRLKDLQ